MNDGQKGFCDLHVASLRDGGMKVSALPERCIAAPVIGDNGGVRCNGVLDETDQRLGASVRHHRESNAPSVTPSLSLVEAAGALALPDFDGTRHEYHVVNTTSFAPRAAANPSFIGFDDFFRLAADPVLVGTHHAGAQLVKYLKSGFVTRQAELPLELDDRDARRLACDQVGRPEPHRERCVRAFHDGASREVAVVLAVAASQNGWAIGETIGIAGHFATRTVEPVAPSCALKVSRARRLVREEALELRQRTRKRQIASIKHVDNHGRPKITQMLNILPAVGLGDNRISTVKRINEAVKNNPEKFPEGYILEFDKSEWDILKSKFSTSIKGGKVKLPSAFTEKGLYMLATILKSPQAIQATLSIIETFSKIRELSREIKELSVIQDKAEQKSLMQKSGALIAEIFDEDLQTSDTETSIELNFAVLKFKHTIKKKNK